MNYVMGLKDAFNSKAKPMRELDAERLVDRFAELRLQPLGELEARDRTKVCGEVKRMTIKPRSGIPSMEIVINDGTGDATVIFSGRRHVAGIEHGHCIVVEGVAFADANRLVFLNPAYSLLPIGDI
jgi:sorbitol-specific phosphotransferase system component IIBC